MAIKQVNTIVKLPAKNVVVAALLLCIVHIVNAQHAAVSIQFKPLYDTMQIEPGKKYPYLHDSVEIEVLKFFVSGIRFYRGDTLIDELEKKHHLIDLEKPSSQTIFHNYRKPIAFNRIVFNIGVDSITNETGAYGGDLDPTNGMYWEWRSGYINAKIEGNSRLCPARKNHFTFHIGGYQHPHNTLQLLVFPVKDSSKIVVAFNVAALLRQVNLSELYEVMSPGEKAVAIAKKMSSVFNIVP